MNSQPKMKCFRKYYRFTDVVAAICIPATFFLTFYVTQLTRDLQMMSAPRSDLNDISFREEFQEDPKPTGNLDNQKTSFRTSLNHIGLDDHIVVAPPLNNTGRGTEDILIFTAIPRTGQSTMRDMMGRLKSPNHFLIVTPPLKEKNVIHIPSEDKRRSVVDKVSSLNGSKAIIDHFAFINFTKYGQKQPIQVSMVRDPLERAISLYYYARAPHEVVERYRIFPYEKLPTRQFLRKSLEACLMDADDPECNYKPNSEREGHTIQYFCGHEDYCSLFANEEGLKRAKRVVEEKFAVVGILEEMEKTMVVLENYVPKFFKNVYNTYIDQLKGWKEFPSTNMYKPTLDEPFRTKLEKKFHIERKFYNFLKRRLNKQYEKLLEGSQISERLNKPNS